MSQHVVWFDSSEVGAPILNNAAGSLIDVLDACLVNGFNLKSVTALVVAGGVATATCNSHGYSGKYSQDIVLAGCDTVALNGRKQLTYVDTNTFRFDATGVADQTATGTITAKRDALGWVKQFTGTNKAIYKRSDPTATSIMLRVVDTAATPATAICARVQMVESATDVDTYTGSKPGSNIIADGAGQFWNKGPNTATSKQWSIIGDSKHVFLLTPDGTVILPGASLTSGGAGLFTFGDFRSYKAGDAYNTLLTGKYLVSADGGTGFTNPLVIGRFGSILVQGEAMIARPFNQAAGDAHCANISGPLYASGTSAFMAYPSPIDGGAAIQMGLMLGEFNVTYKDPVRGQLPQVGFIYSAHPYLHHTIITPGADLPGRQLLILAIGQASGGQYGKIALDLTGPWA